MFFELLLPGKKFSKCRSSFPMWSLQKTDFWDPVFVHHVGLGLFTAISYETSFQSYCTMCRLGFVNGLYKMALHYIYSSRSWLLEKGFSGTMDRTNCTSCAASSFPWFKSVIFLCLWTCKSTVVLQIQWLPRIVTTNTEWIWDDWYDTWNFPVSRAVTAQTCNVQRWSSRWILWEFSLFSAGHNSETTIQKPYVQMAFFLYCDTDLPSLDLAVHFPFTQYVFREHACYRCQKC